jgi:hypothetical protein
MARHWKPHEELTTGRIAAAMLRGSTAFSVVTSANATAASLLRRGSHCVISNQSRTLRSKLLLILSTKADHQCDDGNADSDAMLEDDSDEEYNVPLSQLGPKKRRPEDDDEDTDVPLFS